jgi:hypothetical protein
MERSDNMGDKARILKELNTAMDSLMEASLRISNSGGEQLSEHDFYRADNMLDEAMELVEEATAIIGCNMKGE